MKNVSLSSPQMMAPLVRLSLTPCGLNGTGFVIALDLGDKAYRWRDGLETAEIRQLFGMGSARAMPGKCGECGLRMRRRITCGGATNGPRLGGREAGMCVITGVFTRR
jgi:hypothetical protein